MRHIILLLSLLCFHNMDAQRPEKFVPIICDEVQINHQEIKQYTTTFHIYLGNKPKQDGAKDVEVYSVAPTWEWVPMSFSECKSKQYEDCMCAVSLTPAETMSFKVVEDISGLDPSLYKTTKLSYELSNIPISKVPIICKDRREDVKGLIIEKLEEDGYHSFVSIKGNARDPYFEAQLMDFRVKNGLNTDLVWAADILDYLKINIKDKPKLVLGDEVLFPDAGEKCYGKGVVKKSNRATLQELKYPVYIGNDETVKTEWIHVPSNLPLLGREHRKEASSRYIMCSIYLEDQQYESIEVLLRADGIPEEDIAYKTMVKELKNPDVKEKWVEVVCPDLLTASIIEEIQTALVKRRFLTSGSFRKGGLDKFTKDALVAFQKDKKIPSGPVSIKTLKALKVEAPDMKGKWSTVNSP